MIHLTREQARKVDEICRDVFGMPTVLLMENAARSTALAARQILGGQRGEILILCGPGNNGGDGLAAARHLANGGFPVTCGLLVPDHPYEGDAKVMHDIAAAMDIPLVPLTMDLVKSSPALIIDALFGTGLTRPLAGLAHEVAVLSRALTGPRLAVDLPSGLHADSGKPTGAAAFVATHTITFVAPKAGFANPEAHPYLGQVFIGDIGAPKAAVERATTP